MPYLSATLLLSLPHLSLFRQERSRRSNLTPSSHFLRQTTAAPRPSSSHRRRSHGSRPTSLFSDSSSTTRTEGAASSAVVSRHAAVSTSLSLCFDLVQSSHQLTSSPPVSHLKYLFDPLLRSGHHKLDNHHPRPPSPSPSLISATRDNHNTTTILSRRRVDNQPPETTLTMEHLCSLSPSSVRFEPPADHRHCNLFLFTVSLQQNNKGSSVSLFFLSLYLTTETEVRLLSLSADLSNPATCDFGENIIVDHKMQLQPPVVPTKSRK